MMSRETRLLLATIAVSAVVVLVLSTLRFPETPRISEAPPAPLERLAASAAYEQLARSVERVSRRVTSDLIAVRVGAGNGPAPRNLSDLLANPMNVDVARYFPALRVDDFRALLVGIVDRPQSSVGEWRDRQLPVIAIDPLRRVSLLEVPRASGTPVTPLTLSTLQTPTYVVIAEGTDAGVTFRPVFVGSADRFSDPRWSRQLLAVSGTPLSSPGALVFSLEGQFVGAAVVQPNGTFAIASSAELIAIGNELTANASLPAFDFGLSLQTLTPELGRTLQVTEGVVVASVSPTGPASDALEVTDVVISIDGAVVTSPDDALVRLARTPAGATVQLTIIRNGIAVTVPLTAIQQPRPGSVPTTPGTTFGRIPDVGAEVTSLAPGSALARAGVRVGDLIVRAGDTSAPTPAQLTTALRDAGASGLVVVVRRDNERDRVVALSGSSPE